MSPELKQLLPGQGAGGDASVVEVDALLLHSVLEHPDIFGHSVAKELLLTSFNQD